MSDWSTGSRNVGASPVGVDYRRSRELTGRRARTDAGRRSAAAVLTAPEVGRRADNRRRDGDRARPRVRPMPASTAERLPILAHRLPTAFAWVTPWARTGWAVEDVTGGAGAHGHRNAYRRRRPRGWRRVSGMRRHTLPRQVSAACLRALCRSAHSGTARSSTASGGRGCSRSTP